MRNDFVAYYRYRFLHFGKGAFISPFGIYLYPDRIHIGDHVYIGPRAFISAVKGIVFGNGVTIGPEIMVMAGDHDFRRVGHRIYESTEGGCDEKIIIGDDVWIGARVILLKGVFVGEGAVIGAGSVVTTNVIPYAVYAGNPARKIGTRFLREELREHLLLVKSRCCFEDLVDILYV